MFLYIIEATEPTRKLYKIGITNDLEKRIRGIKTGNPYPVKYVYYEEFDHASKIERWLHIQFKNFKLEGEWFHSITVEDIRTKIFTYNDLDY